MIKNGDNKMNVILRSSGFKALRLKLTLRAKSLFAVSGFVMAASLIPSALAAVFTLSPSADSYVKNSAVSSNFGSDANFIANNANGVRVSFLRFDLSAVSGSITNLRLELTVNIASAGQTFNVYGLTNGESWSETGITWANAPAVVNGYVIATGTLSQYLKPSDLFGGGQIFNTFTSGALGTLDVAFDAASGPVIDFINADADKIVTFVIAEPDPVDISGVAWNSREAASGQPALIVTTDSAGTNNPVTSATPKLLRVVLLGGQSNADGRAAGGGLPTNLQSPQTNVQFYYYTYGMAANADGTLGALTTLRPGCTQMPAGGFGPEVKLGYDLSRIIEQSPGTQLAIIKYAKGGSSLAVDWKPNGNATTNGDGVYYQTFQRVVRDGMAKLRSTYSNSTVQLAGMVWVQGETDIDGGSVTAVPYGTNLTAFINDVRQTFCPTLPFCFSRISSQQTVYSTPTSNSYPNYLLVRSGQALVAATVTNAYLIDTDSTNFTMNSDHLHFDAGGQQAMGAAFAAQLAKILNLRISEAALIPGGLRLAWNAVPGKSYSVLNGTNLTNWSTQSLGAVDSWTNSLLPGLRARFFRVQEIYDGY